MSEPALEAESGAGGTATATAPSASPDQGGHAPPAQANSAGEEGDNVTVFHLMSRETASHFAVPGAECATIAEQRDRLFPHIKILSGLSEQAVAVAKAEAAHLLDIEGLAKAGFKTHTSGSLEERGAPRTLTDNGRRYKFTPGGKARVYGAIGGPAQVGYPYDKRPLEIKGAREHHCAVATVIAGVRSALHCDTRFGEGETGVLAQVSGHVVYIIFGESCELHIHRLKRDVQLFSRSIAVGAFSLYVGKDGFLAIKLHGERDVTQHGAVAAGLPRVQLLARHVLSPLLPPLEVHDAHASLRRGRVGISGPTGDLGTAMAWLSPMALLQSSPPFGD